MKDNRDSIDFGKEPVGKIFRKMFLPTLVAMVTMVVLNITDGAFVGHGVGSDALYVPSLCDLHLFVLLSQAKILQRPFVSPYLTNRLYV